MKREKERKQPQNTRDTGISTNASSKGRGFRDGFRNVDLRCLLAAAAFPFARFRSSRLPRALGIGLRRRRGRRCGQDSGRGGGSSGGGGSGGGCDERWGRHMLAFALVLGAEHVVELLRDANEGAALRQLLELSRPHVRARAAESTENVRQRRAHWAAVCQAGRREGRQAGR